MAIDNQGKFFLSEKDKEILKSVERMQTKLDEDIKKFIKICTSRS